MANSPTNQGESFSTFRPWLFVAFASALVVMSALSVNYSTYQTRRLVAEFQQLHNRRNEMDVEWGQLLLEQSTWGSFNRVEQLASKRLKMIVPEPNQIVMVIP